ncbi:MAG: hypothetical protein ABGY75_11835 [Gemmataceae bacterium]
MTEDVLHTARRAGADPFFLAFALARYAEEQQMDEPALAAALAATPETLAHARLCKMPRTDPTGLKEDVDRIAAKFGLNRGVLLLAVRCGQVAAVHQVAVEQGGPEDAAPMLAARDRQEELRPPGSGE